MASSCCRSFPVFSSSSSSSLPPPPSVVSENHRERGRRRIRRRSHFRSKTAVRAARTRTNAGEDFDIGYDDDDDLYYYDDETLLEMSASFSTNALVELANGKRERYFGNIVTFSA